jgi:hypothetical protein
LYIFTRVKPLANGKWQKTYVQAKRKRKMAKPGAVLFLGILLPNIHFFNEGCK